MDQEPFVVFDRRKPESDLFTIDTFTGPTAG